MHDELDPLESRLLRRPAPSPREAPEQFFRSVRLRRRRVLATRAAAAFALALAAGISVWLLRPAPAPAVSGPIQLAASKGPSALRRLRELPPEVPGGPGPIESARVLDARDPASIGLGGF